MKALLVSLVLISSLACAQQQASPQNKINRRTKPLAASAQPVPISAVKPNESKFDTYESYIEALVEWHITQKAATIPLAPAASGRYQIFFRTGVRADTFLLDTQTGRIWQPVQYSDIVGEPDVWQPVARVDSNQELSEWISRHTPKPKAATSNKGNP